MVNRLLFVFLDKYYKVTRSHFLYQKYYRVIKSRFFHQFSLKNNFLKFMNYTYAGINLKKLSSKCKGLEDYINLVFTYRFSHFKEIPLFNILPWQSKTEIYEFCKLITPIRPKVILEIGTANGGTLFLLSKISSPDALIISIDLPEGRFGGGYPSKFKHVYKKFASRNQKMFLLRKDSHKSSSMRKVKKILNKKLIDVLFIDGDHTYDGVKKDFEMYSPLVNRNGVIAFHDIVVVPPEKELNVDVNIFWNDIKEFFEYKEIVEDWDQEYGGIGIIKMKRENINIASILKPKN